MEIKLKGKTYKCGVITRAKNRIYEAASEKFRIKSEKQEPFNDEDYEIMVETIVKLYDNENVTEDAINDEMEISDIIFAFMNVQIQVQGKLNSKIEQAQKAFTKRK